MANLLKTNLEKGIHEDDEELLKRRSAFGSNTYPRKKGRSFWVIFSINIKITYSVSLEVQEIR